MIRPLLNSEKNQMEQLSRIDHICDLFEDSWKINEPRNIAELLNSVDNSERTMLMMHLMRIEFELLYKNEQTI